MIELAEFIGWIAVWGFCFGVLSYLIKFINKVYISKLPQQKKKSIYLYHFTMKLIIKYHKTVGILTVIAAIIHMILMFGFFELNLSGIIAVGLMLCLLLSGLYGALINKKRNGYWLKIHKAFTIVLIIVIMIHIAG